MATFGSLGPARNVSPAIRFGRYVALISGIVYGSLKYRSLTNKEQVIQAHEKKIKAVRDAKLKAQKDAYTKTEMNALAEEVGIPNRM